MKDHSPRKRGWIRLVLTVALFVLPAGAMAQGKRLGLVIGLADYGEVKHPTALQDAGLVAQSLRQAGFELTESANLNQTEFRATFRDFTEKAQAAGPDALIAVYVSGIGFQDDGENLLIPVDARLRQRADLALEGIRINDLIRTIGAIPAAGRVVILDAAYTHPFGQLTGEGGRGFAAGERREGMLVAYNQAPDRVSPLPATNYGHYAMALAEVLREPGIDLGAMFERIRLRTHDLSQGVETPWDINGLSQPIVLFPGTAAPAASAALEAKRARPIRELPGDEAYARAVEIDTIAAYEEFLGAYPRHAQARRVRAMVATRREAFYWQRARRTNTDRAYWSYLRRYPRGAHAVEAQARLTRLSAPIVPPPQFDEIIYDDLPPPDIEEVEVYETVVIEERWEVLPPPSGYAVHLLPPPPVEIIELPPPPLNPQARTLPSVGIGAAIVGAGVVGAAIWANREWRRPREVRPAVAPPPRAPRPSVLPPGTVLPPPPRPGTRPIGVPPPVGLPVGNPTRPIGQGPVTQPPVAPPTGGPLPPPAVPPGTTAPGVTPPVGTPPPGVRPPTGGPLPPPAVPPGTTAPGVTPPVGTPPPGVRPPTGGPLPPPAVPPGTTAPGVTPHVGTPPPGAIRPSGPTGPRPIGGPPPSPPGAVPRPAGPPPGAVPPPAVTRPVPPSAPRPIGAPPPQNPPPQFRPVPPRPGPGEPPPQFRPVPRPPAAAPPPPQARPVPPPPPVARPVAPPPPPVARPAPPPPPAARPAPPPPPPVARPAPPPPPPAARPPAPGPIGQCTPELRARGACR
ncbi:MAG: caspase family protein [Beijerinckiaceae bacterium]|nr:caspase family protein [Beijerinckiaceae bacterium]